MKFDLHFSHVMTAEVAAEEKICDRETVNKQESNSSCYVPLSAGAHRERWRLNELERFVMPSGCYHCYKCSGPHSHTLSPLNNPKTARHPHRYHLIAFFLPLLPWQQQYGQIVWLVFPSRGTIRCNDFFRSFTTYLEIAGATFWASQGGA